MTSVDRQGLNQQKIMVEGPKPQQENGLPAGEHNKGSSTDASKIIPASHSPSCSDTSSLFSTVDCSSFSSRSDASSFAKEDSLSVAAPSLGLSVRSSVEFTSSSKVDTASSADSGSILGETEYFEFSFRKGRILENASSSAAQDGSAAVASTSTSEENDYERYPVWTRYCSTDIHSCINNPCFEKTGDSSEPRMTRSKKLAKTMGSVLSKHLGLSPGPTFRRVSCDRFSSRLGLDHPSPSGKFPATPGSTFDSKNSASSRVGTSRKTNVYKASPKRYTESRKSLGCLGGPRLSGGAEAIYDGEPLYDASQETVHGGKTRCLPSPRLSFGSARVFKQDSEVASSSSASMAVPSTTIRGQLHCIQRGDLPSFTFLVDGLEEVFVAKAARPGSPSSMDTGESLYTFYSWRPKGRARGSWKSWMRKDKVPPDFVGRMSVSSKVVPATKDVPTAANIKDVPASNRDEAGIVDLEFILHDDNGSCSPRLSFSTWDTSSTHTVGRSPSPATYNSFPSPFCPTTPSPCRLASSRYVSISNTPPVRLRRSRRIPCSPLRPRSDDDRSSDTWSDTEADISAETGKESHELAAIVIRLPLSSACDKLTLRSLNQKWERAKKSTGVSNLGKSSSSYYYQRRMSLPGRLQGGLEAKENENLDAAASCSEINNRDLGGASQCSRTKSLKLRELMGVGEDFGKRKKASPGNITVTGIIPAGNHGIPLHGNGGPDPLIERWRSGGRCDCGSWDLGCGLTILTGDVPLVVEEEETTDTIEIFSQGAKGEKQVVMSLTTVEDGLFSFAFQAPMSYLQAFASAVATLYTRGPSGVCASAPIRISSKLPRFPLRPLASAAAAVDALSYCTPPPASLLDRL